MLVLVGHEQAVEPLGGHGGADAGQVAGPVGRIGGLFEALAHERYLGPTCGVRKGRNLAVCGKLGYEPPMVRAEALACSNSNDPTGVVRMRTP
ncbi:MAG: hypothetical protein IM641_11540 [Phenylobacterium sp.]|nr:hypothetical protein [Phenylobacterium sp.]